jgi:hypothetical protein
MEISNGEMASQAYFKMNELQHPVELNKLRSALFQYCRLDTLAMVKILEALNKKRDKFASGISSVPTFLPKITDAPMNIGLFSHLAFFDLNWTRNFVSKDFSHLRV